MRSRFVIHYISSFSAKWNDVLALEKDVISLQGTLVFHNDTWDVLRLCLLVFYTWVKFQHNAWMTFEKQFLWTEYLISMLETFLCIFQVVWSFTLQTFWQFHSTLNITCFLLLWKGKELSLQVKKQQHSIGKNVVLTKRLLWSIKLFSEFWYTALANYSFSLFTIGKYAKVVWDFLR